MNIQDVNDIKRTQMLMAKPLVPEPSSRLKLLLKVWKVTNRKVLIKFL